MTKEQPPGADGAASTPRRSARDSAAATVAATSIPQRIAAFALAATLFVLALLGLARHNLFGEILGAPSPDSSREEGNSLRVRSEGGEDWADFALDPASLGPAAAATNGEGEGGPYLVFLQKFPLESSFRMLFHTEVVVCPRSAFEGDPTFLTAMDGLLGSLAPSRFVDVGAQAEADAGTQGFAAVEESLWTTRSEPACVQLGYGGANCGSGCCGSPHRHDQTHYALNSRKAVIGNAMGEYKELYLYGTSDDLGGEAAYRAVCHGHMNAVEMSTGLPSCVSNWAGRDYNPLTNNCNTFTSAVLKCVYGLSDAKPHLGVSDMRTVSCPKEARDGAEVEQCTIPQEIVVGEGKEASVSVS